MISSSRNPKIQWVHALQTRPRQRLQDQAFVIEGVRLVEEAFRSHWKTKWVLYTTELDQRGRKLLAEFEHNHVPVEEVTPQIMRHICDTQTPQGILAVMNQKCLPLDPGIDFVFIPDEIRDPGNLGTMLRTAFAAGCNAVFVPKGSVDIYSPKVIRSAMGAHFHLPILALSWQEIEIIIKKHGLHVFLADSNAGVQYAQADFRQPLALIIGSEAEGAGDYAQKLAHEHLFIPMPGAAESLNAAIAAGILLFMIVQQRTSTS
ncbi:MAG: RNA methyltransferase [Anaerolineales bacterium]|nr:RNA methyltransferase [Anaerolineales bacterium]